MLVLSAHRASSYKIGQPERVQRGKLLNSVGIFKPLLPKVVMLFVCHSALALKKQHKFKESSSQRTWPNSQGRSTILVIMLRPEPCDHHVEVSKLMNDAYLREIFESGESDDCARLTVNNCYSEI